MVLQAVAILNATKTPQGDSLNSSEFLGVQSVFSATVRNEFGHHVRLFRRGKAYADCFHRGAESG